LLGPALANTGLHELGHFIANLEHLTIIMSGGGSKQKLAERNIKTQREFWATPQTSTTARRSAWWRSSRSA